MSRFAKVNLLEVEDSVAGRVEGLEGRFGRKHLDSRDLGVSLFRYAPNLRSPMAHSHKEQEEAYVVAAGSGRILLDDEIHELKTLDVIRVAPEVVRAFEAGPDGLDIIAVGGPKPEEGDGVRATAAWPDAKEPLDYSTAPRGTDHRIQSELRESGRLFRRESNRSSPQGWRLFPAVNSPWLRILVG